MKSSWEEWCVHYNGITKKVCKAGVVYLDVRQPVDGTKYEFPCFKDDGNGKGCGKCRFPTEEEIKAHHEMLSKMFDGSMLARQAIVEHLKGPWKKGMAGSQGLIDCPVCEKTLCLSFVRHGSSGHIHATCRTLGCVSWME